jgi:hypothetical protein
MTGRAAVARVSGVVAAATTALSSINHARSGAVGRGALAVVLMEPTSILF